MSYRLPPLNALRAFEATSRLLSAKKAAEELHVTPAAISHQIKLLESQLGFPLFKRLNRQLLLTEPGQRYAKALQDIFKKLSDETEKLTHHLKSTLSLTVEPAFAIYWLIPRLDKFKKHYPDIELRISANLQMVDFKESSDDIGIRLGNGKYPGLNTTLLFRNNLYPVCSPRLLKKHSLKKPNDLKFHTLLHRTPANILPGFANWRTWLKEANAKEVNPEQGMYFETGYLVIQAAIEGQGVALEREAFVKSAIAQGQLVRPFKQMIHESDVGYYLVFPEGRESDTKIQRFIKWIKSEIKNDFLI